MTEKRYHIYISTALDDLKSERLKLESSLLNLGTFPWEFKERRTSLNTALARRQIDDCDYVIVVLGGKYGDLSASGISYTHLDFLYALNKHKTIISLVDKVPEKRMPQEQENSPEIIKKMQALKDLLKRDSQYYFEFNGLLDLERAIRNIFVKAVKDAPALGWIRPKNNDVLIDEVQRLRQKIVSLEQELIQTQHDVKLVKPSTSLSNVQNTPEGQKVTVSYRTHAYQDGNLKDIRPHRDIAWIELLKVLAPHFKQPALENSFLRILNQYLEDVAIEDARQILPRAHAVARTQIDTRCLQQIKLQMKWNNWIIPEPELSASGSRVYWVLTQEGERLLGGKVLK